MKVMFLVPERYGLFSPLRDAFTSQGAEVHPIDFFKTVKKWERQVNTQIFRAPDRARMKWEHYYFRKINAYYQQEYNRIQPDVVFVYNNEMLLPETVDRFKKESKVVFFLGDSPFYTPTNRFNLTLLFQADQVFAPDTFWIHQLRKTGLENIHHLVTGIPEDLYFELDLSQEEEEKYQHEVLYVGTCYPSSWGYKKARFLSHFSAFDLKILGNRHWQRWISFFPELKPHFQLRAAHIPVEEMNRRYNAARIVPIDGNPGLLHGFHSRLMEALGAGALPMLEWQEDLAAIFGKDADLPAPATYAGLEDMARFYLENEDKRQEKVQWMKSVAREKLSPARNGQRIMELLFTGTKKIRAGKN